VCILIIYYKNTPTLFPTAFALTLEYNTANSIRAKLGIISVSFVTLLVVFPIDNLCYGKLYELATGVICLFRAFMSSVQSLGHLLSDEFHLLWETYLWISCLYSPSFRKIG